MRIKSCLDYCHEMLSSAFSSSEILKLQIVKHNWNSVRLRSLKYVILELRQHSLVLHLSNWILLGFKLWQFLQRNLKRTAF